jgi:branched-chain amino acid:cation transporter, LIVCS family
MLSRERLLLLGVIVSTGFAMFAMFFGSGNLVFPIMLGDLAGDDFFWPTLGLILTGVVLPFLGLLVIMLYKGDYNAFFARIGQPFDFLLLLIVLGLMGPFGALPRCITVAFGSFELIFPGSSSLIFNCVFAGATFLLMLDRNKIVPIIGTVLTPVLLLMIFVIIIYGGLQAEPLVSGTQSHMLKDFVQGVIQGYRTLDLVAAFFFASIVIRYIDNKLAQSALSLHRRRVTTLWAMILGGSLLALIYVGFVFLGSAYGQYLSPEFPERNIAIIVFNSLGPNAGPVVTVAVILACLTTAIALTSVTARFLQQRICQNRIHYHVSVTIILVISLVIADFNFMGIAAFLSPAVSILYPGLIVLTILNICHKLYGWQIVKTPVYATFALAAASTLLL